MDDMGVTYTDRQLFLVPTSLPTFEWKSKDIVFAELQKRMHNGFRKVSNYAKEKSVSLRTGALMLGINQVAQAKILRGLYP